MPFYEDMSDLIFKIENYLEDKDAYSTITDACENIVRQNHNSKDSVDYILDIVK